MREKTPRHLRYLGYLTLLLLGGGLLSPLISYATLTLDSTSLTSDGALTLKSASSSATTLGHADQSGTITIASTTQALTVDIGKSTSALTLSIASGTGGHTVNIATGTSTAKTINIGTGSQTINTITIGNASSSIALSGTLRITEGNQGAGKLLGSDTSGGATWQAVDGWTDAGETWTFASDDDPTFTFYINGDKTSKYSAGMRMKLTQTTAKYFIVTAVSYSAPSTTVTIYGGTDYNLTNAAITSPFYSVVKAPQGFPLDPTKWTVEFTDTSQRQQLSPSSSTWYNPGSLSSTIPIGAWHVEYTAELTVSPTSGTSLDIWSTLSTANNSESDKKFSARYQINATGASVYRASPFKRNTIVLTSKTTYYLNVQTVSSNMAEVTINGGDNTTIIRAVSAYR